MPVIDVIKWEINDKEFCHKYPSDNISMGAQLVVYPGQTAFFVRGGKICDSFGQGTYTIQSDNIPILDALINVPFGSASGDAASGKSKSPFKAEVWFVNTVTRLDLKWGTPVPLQLEDPKYNIIVPVGAFGQYGIKICDPALFLATLIGNMPGFTVTQIEAGSAHNVIPDRCRFVVDIRPTEMYGNQEIMDELQAVCKSRLKARNLKNRSSATACGSPLLDCIASLGLETYSSPTTSDWIRIGCDAVKMGPGKSSRSHKKDEYITRDEIEGGITGYIAFIERLAEHILQPKR